MSSLRRDKIKKDIKIKFGGLKVFCKTHSDVAYNEAYHALNSPSNPRKDALLTRIEQKLTETTEGLCEISPAMEKVIKKYGSVSAFAKKLQMSYTSAYKELRKSDPLRIRNIKIKSELKILDCVA